MGDFNDTIEGSVGLAQNELSDIYYYHTDQRSWASSPRFQRRIRHSVDNPPIPAG